jgi:hypothetical protein
MRLPDSSAFSSFQFHGGYVIRSQTERRSIEMNFGFNSNIRVGDAVFHVQTEDRGPSHPFLDTLVYAAGRVVYKRSTSYKDFMATASKAVDLAQQLHDRLSQQHREVIVQLEAGTLHLLGKTKPETQAPIEEESDGLDVSLMNPKAWLSPSGVALEVELRRRISRKEVEAAEVEALVEREKQRIHCAVAHTDAAGRATLEFQMPAAASEGATLVIRATDGSLYGELRFHLKAKKHGPASAPVAR